ncbi:MAG TPA: glutamate racemase [Acholeplasmataceae bacterium]|nr:glutamate racemase [Acholeplasmataceae bacterium]
MIDKRPIGVFDSGIGGLTVLEVLMEKFPSENFIYLADTYNCPYGEKSSAEVEKITTENSLFLNNMGIKALVIACNTATANSINLYKYLDIPIIGVIEPTANYAKKVTTTNNIMVIATDLTISLGNYQNCLKDQIVTAVKASEFVKIVEEGKIEEEESFEIIKDKLSPHQNKNIDTIILGCTHFPLLSKNIQKLFPSSNLVSSGLATADELKKSIINNSENNEQTLILFTTGSKEELINKITWFTKKIDFIHEVTI